MTHGSICRLLLIFVVTTFLMFPRSTYAEANTPDRRWHSFTVENGLAGNIVQDIWEDPTGAIWFGTENGISRYDGKTWTTYRDDDGLSDNNVWSISGDAETVWCATSNGVSVFRNGQWERYSTADGLPGNDVRAVLASTNGSVWVGTFGGGIGLKRPGAEQWEPFTIPPELRSTTSFVQSIWQSPSGDIWFSTNSFGAIRLRNETFDPFKFRLGSRNTVWAVGAETETNTTWLATFRGIVKINNDDTITVVNEMIEGVPISTTEVLTVAGGVSDDLWFGTRAAGVFHHSNNVWQRYTTTHGLGSNYVQSILVDRANRVWFGTRGSGVTLLDRRPLPLQALQPAITITDIQSNSFIDSTKALLDYRQNNLQFTFTIATEWLPPQDFQVRYRLEQDDHGEVISPHTIASLPQSPARAVTRPFIALRPGDYILHVTPFIGAIAGPEQLYTFTIRSAPPTFTADTLQVRIDNQSVRQGWSLPQSIFNSTRFVQLYFQANDDTTASDQLQYRYRRTGESVWHTTYEAQATIALPQGQHWIEAQAVDIDGNSSTPITLAVIVPAPLWTTILTYLALILVPSVIGSLFGALGYRRWARHQALRRAVNGYIIPYDVGPLITVPDRYIGRRHILDTILGKLTNNSFYIWGEKRIGKTSLLLQLKQRLLQRNNLQDEQFFIPVFRNIQDLPQPQFWLYLVRSIAAELPGPANTIDLALLSETTEMNYDDFDAENDLEVLISYVQEQVAPRRPCIVLLLDEVDTLQRYDSSIRQRFRAFCQHTQRYIRVVLAGVHPPRGEAIETSPWYNIFEPITLGPLTQPDTLTLIRHYNHNPYRYTPDAEQMILSLGDGKPFDTQWLCSEAVKAMLAAQRGVITQADVKQAVQVIVNERSHIYAAGWRQLSPTAQDSVCHALKNNGTLPLQSGSIGEELVEAGLALKTVNGYQLPQILQRWLQERITRPEVHTC